MNLPNKLTVVRILMIPVFIVLFFLPFSYCRFIALGIFMLASFTDFLDGYIARKYHLVTNLGKFLDPIADKMLVAAALIGVCLDVHALQISVAVCTIIILARELMVSGFRIVASSKNVVLAADKLGKIKTVLQMFSVFLLIPYTGILAYSRNAAVIVLTIGIVLLYLATIMTLVSGINYIYKNRQVLKDEPAADAAPEVLSGDTDEVTPDADTAQSGESDS